MYLCKLAEMHSEIQGSFPPIRLANWPNIGWDILESDYVTLMYRGRVPAPFRMAKFDSLDTLKVRNSASGGFEMIELSVLGEEF